MGIVGLLEVLEEAEVATQDLVATERSLLRSLEELEVLANVAEDRHV